jgi:hypothetical protein
MQDRMGESIALGVVGILVFPPAISAKIRNISVTYFSCLVILPQRTSGTEEVDPISGGGSR